MIGRMKEPPRLGETLDGGSALALGLREARARRPTDDVAQEAERRLFAVLGAGSAVATPRPATQGRMALASKVVLTLAAGAALTSVGAHFWRRPHEPPVASPAARGAAPLGPSAPRHDASGVRPLPAAPPAEGATNAIHRTARRRVAPAAKNDRLARELRLIEPARAALATDPARALALCAQHQREFPDGGAMAEEREFIAISALARTQRPDEARARAAAFHERYPASPYGDRLR